MPRRRPTPTDRAAGLKLADVDYVILADAANEVQGKIYILGGGFIVHHATLYPSLFRFSIVVGVLLPQNLANIEQVVTLSMVGPSGRELVRAEAGFRSASTDTKAVPLRPQLTIQSQYLLPEPGIYEISAQIGTRRKSAFFEALPALEQTGDNSARVQRRGTAEAT